mgnify:CR=1 FL=1
MKLVLASQGFMTKEIVDAVVNLVNKPKDKIKISIINEAYVGLEENKDKHWLIKELGLIEKNFKGIIDFVNLRAYGIQEIEKRLKDTDIIYIVGGKQFILAKLFKEIGFDNLLKKLAKDKVIMGTSAGSIVLGKTVESNEYYLDRYKINKKDIEVNNLGFVDFNIIPHYLRADRLQYSEEYYKRILKDNTFKMYAINDNQAIIYNEGKLEFIGGEPVVF